MNSLINRVSPDAAASSSALGAVVGGDAFLAGHGPDVLLSLGVAPANEKATL